MVHPLSFGVSLFMVLVSWTTRCEADIIQHSQAYFDSLEANKDCIGAHRQKNNFDYALKKWARPFNQNVLPIGLPTICPSGWDEHGVQFINMRPFDWRDASKTMVFDYKNKQNAVGAIGGVVDQYGRAIDRSTAYMAIAANHKTHSFDLEAFDFWCTDQFFHPVDCRIAVVTSQARELVPVAPLTFEFKTRPNATESRPAHAIIPPDRGSTLKVLGLGRNLAVLNDLGLLNDTYNGTIPGELFANAIATDLNANHVTVYIDNISYFTHECGDKEPANPFNGALKKVFEYPGCPQP